MEELRRPSCADPPKSAAKPPISVKKSSPKSSPASASNTSSASSPSPYQNSHFQILTKGLVYLGDGKLLRLDRLSEEVRAGVGEGDGAGAGAGAGQGEQKGRGCRSNDAVSSDGPATAKRKQEGGCLAEEATACLWSVEWQTSGRENTQIGTRVIFVRKKGNSNGLIRLYVNGPKF
ncbi:hypothetical protein AAHA92_24783 [Salvia divinorum]|uniref:Uncharacterized protein n=1 Tax=Salvia divinorum TaxID=28513 RepID=A0ABD1GBM3_SALDI